MKQSLYEDLVRVSKYLGSAFAITVLTLVILKTL